MGITQYIGARYVPLPDGPWDSTKNYEPLIIVEDNNGNSYTSKKYVPAGTALTNREYWAPTGSTSGAIQSLQTRVDALETENTQQNAEIAEQGEAINENARDFLGKNIRKYVLIGDSFCDPNRGGFARGLATIVQTYLDAEDADFHVYARGGAGYVSATQGKTFGDLLNDAIAEIAEEEKLLITDLILMGGGNDAASSITLAQINEAVTVFMQTAKAEFPNAFIHIALVNGDNNVGNQIRQRNNVSYVLSYCSMNYLKNNYISNAQLPMMYLPFHDDSAHPNLQGLVALGKLVGSAVLNCSSIGSFNLARGVLWNNIEISACDTCYTVELKKQVNIQKTIEVTQNYGFIAEMGDIPVGGGLIDTASNTSLEAEYCITLPIDVDMYVSGSEIYTERGNIVLTGGKVYIVCASGKKTYTATWIRLRPFTTIITAMQ